MKNKKKSLKSMNKLANSFSIINRVGELTKAQENQFLEDNKRAIEFIFSQSNALTKSAYSQILKKFFETIPAVSLKEINIGHIELYRLNYLNAKSINTQRNAIQVLRAFFQDIFEDRYIDRNPFKRIKPPKKEEESFLKRIPSRDDINKLKSFTKNDRDKLLIDFLYKTGLRISEALSLKIEDFKENKEGAYEAYFKGKGNKTGLVKVRNDFYEDLLNITGEEGFIFRNLRREKHKAVTSKHVANLFKKLSKEAKIKPEIHPHALRHAHGTHAILNGARIEEIQKGLRHSSIDMSVKYSKTAINKTSSDYID